MKVTTMRALADEYGYGNISKMIEEKCPSEFGYIDYSEMDNGKCCGDYKAEQCIKCWKEAARAEEIDDNETFVLARKAFDTDEEYEEYLKRLADNIPKEAHLMPVEGTKEQVHHPHYYQQENRRECIEEMRLMFGDAKVYWWCVMTAYKYRYRTGNKDGNPAEQDNKKAEFYLDYAEELKI